MCVISYAHSCQPADAGLCLQQMRFLCKIEAYLSNGYESLCLAHLVYMCT